MLYGGKAVFAAETGRGSERASSPAPGRPPVLFWKHGTTKTAAIESLKNELRRLGYDGFVNWDGCEARARVTRLFFRIIDARGRVTDDAVIIEKCRGMAAQEVLKRCRAALQRLFPGEGATNDDKGVNRY